MKETLWTTLTVSAMLLLPLGCQQDQKAERIEEQAEQKAEGLEERAEQIEERGEERADIVEEMDDEQQVGQQPAQQDEEVLDQ